MAPSIDLRSLLGSSFPPDVLARIERDLDGREGEPSAQPLDATTMARAREALSAIKRGGGKKAGAARGYLSLLAARGIDALWKDDKDDDHDAPIIVASSWAVIPGLGPALLLAARRGNEYNVRLLLPNLKELEFTVTVNGSGEIGINNDGIATLKDPVTRTRQDVRIQKDSGSKGTIVADFGGGRILRLSLSVEAPRQGDVHGARVVLQPIQPQFEGDNRPLITIVRTGGERTNVVAVDFIANVSVGHGQEGGRNTYHLVLSNGDVIELIIYTSHHSGSEIFRAEQARLHRFANERDNWTPINISGSGGRQGSVRIEGAGYDISVPLTAPQASRGGTITFHTDRIEIKQAPKFVAPTQAVTVADFTGETIEPLKGIWLVPDEESARLLLHPPYDDQPAELKFIGEIGGRRIGSNKALVIKGQFMGGRFVASISGEMERRYLFPTDRREQIEVDLVATEDGQIEVRVPLRAGSAVEAATVEHAGLLGFGTDSQVVAEKLDNVFSAKVLAGRGKIRVTEWLAADITIKNEVARFIPRAVARWNTPHVVTYDRSRPDIIRVQLQNSSPLLFQRKIVEETVEYEIIGTEDAGTDISLLTLGEGVSRTIEGLRIERGDGSVDIRPWPGCMSFASVTPNVATTFTDPTLRSISVLLRHDTESSRVVIKLSKTSPDEVSGVLSRVEQNGIERVVFVLEDGHLLQVELPRGMNHEDGLATLAVDPDSKVSFEAREVDVSGRTVREGKIVVVAGEWVFQPTEGSCQNIQIDTLARTPVIRLTPHIIEPPPVTPPPVVEPPPAASTEEPSAPPTTPTFISPPAEPRFPWEHGRFLLPSQETRTLMRAGLNRGIAEGTRRQFVFYGDPHSPDNTYTARVILDRTERYGKRSKTFFGWIFRCNMVFRRGQWIPDSTGWFHVERRIPEYDSSGKNIIGNQLFVDTQYRTRLARLGTGWAISTSDQGLIQPFRVLLERGSRIGISPDFGLSLGEPTDAAKKQLQIVEEKTGATVEELPVQPITRIGVDAVVDEGITGRVMARFGDPIYRVHAPIGTNIGLIEFSPGYFEQLTGSRFTLLHLHDGNGLNVRMVFQHHGNRVNVVRCEAMGQHVDTRLLAINGEGDGRFRLGGLLRIGLGRGIPFQIGWRQEGSEFRLTDVTLDQEQITIEGLRFNPTHWATEQIEQAREGSEVRATVTRVQGRKVSGGGRPPITTETTHGRLNVMIPDSREALANGTTVFGVPLPDVITTTYGLPDGRRIGVPLRYDGRYQAYEVVSVGNNVLVTVDGRSHVATCQRTESGRNWVLEINGTRLFLGNFYVNETEQGGRPVPILWISPTTNPFRSAVYRVLEEQQLAPPAQRVALRQHFDMVTDVAGQRYTVPMRTYSRQDGSRTRLLVAPTGPARKKVAGERTETVVTNYYLPIRRIPAVIEMGGQAFELSTTTLVSGGRGHTMLLRRTHPGASAIRDDLRARNSVMLEPNDQSALLFLDLNLTPFTDEIRSAQEDVPVVRRQLVDAISNRVYELIFKISRDDHGQQVLDIRGMAGFSETGVEIIPLETVEVRGRIYLRLPDGHYLSFSRYPSTSLAVSSHGRSLSTDIVRRPWSDVPLPDRAVFSQTPAAVDRPILAEEYHFDTPDKRLAARRVVAEKFGIEEVLIWDVTNPFPHGVIIHPKRWDVTNPNQRIYQRGNLTIEGTLRTGYHPENLRVTYRTPDGEIEIPHELFIYHGKRPFLILRGPLDGVVFYWIGAGPRLTRPTEITHPALRESLERDLDCSPMERPKLSRRGRGDKWDYPPVEGELQDVIERQVARTRLWRLRQDGVLPSEPAAQDNLARILIPDTEGYRAASRPALLVALEEMADGYRDRVAIILTGLAEGDLNVEELRQLVGDWQCLKEAKDDAKLTVAAKEIVEDGLTSFARRVAEARRAKGKPPVLKAAIAAVAEKLKGSSPGYMVIPPPIPTAAELRENIQRTARVMRSGVRLSAPIAARGVTNAAVGGIPPFIVGEYVSNLLTGHPNPPLADVGKTYVPLAVGGGVGRVLVDGAIRISETRGWITAPAQASAESLKFAKGVARRGIPLFLALTLAEYARNRKVNLEQMPVAMTNILLASTITHGTGQLLMKASFAKKIAVALKLAKAAGVAASPETLGTTLLGACLASVLEFTIIKILGDMEEKAITYFNERTLRRAYADALRRCNDLMEAGNRGETVSRKKLVEAEQTLYTSGMQYEAFLNGRITTLKDELQRQMDNLRREELEAEGRPLDGRLAVADIKAMIRAKREQLRQGYNKRIREIEEGSQQSPQLAQRNVSPKIPLWGNLLRSPTSLRFAPHMGQMLSKATQIDKIEDTIAANLPNFTSQRTEDITRYNDFWLSRMAVASR